MITLQHKDKGALRMELRQLLKKEQTSYDNRCEEEGSWLMLRSAKQQQRYTWLKDVDVQVPNPRYHAYSQESLDEAQRVLDASPWCKHFLDNGQDWAEYKYVSMATKLIDLLSMPGVITLDMDMYRQIKLLRTRYTNSQRMKGEQ